MNQASKFEVGTNGLVKPTRPVFNVVIACLTRTAVAHAMRHFTALVRQFGDEFEFHLVSDLGGPAGAGATSERFTTPSETFLKSVTQKGCHE